MSNQRLNKFNENIAAQGMGGTVSPNIELTNLATMQLTNLNDTNVPSKVIDEPMPALNEWEQSEIKPKRNLIIKRDGFTLYKSGLFKTIEHNGDFDDVRVGNYINVVGKTNINGIYCLLLEFIDTNNRKIDFLLERGDLADTKGLIKKLLNSGYSVGLKIKNELIQYLNTCHTEKELKAVMQIGWLDNCYVLPDRIIGVNADIKYYGKSNNRFLPSGTLEEWKQNIAENCSGYDILEMSLYLGFASMLVGFVGFGFGIHIFGDSSKGKSTALMCASSIFGKPKEYINKWNATHNGMEFIGYNSNHALCALDEVSEAGINTLDSIYMLVDGVGRSRAISKTTGVEQANIKRWLTAVISTGEDSIEDMAIKHNRQLKAGEFVRMIDLQIDTVCKDEQHANLLNENMTKYYGVANVAFIEYLQKHKIEVKKLHKETLNQILDQYANLHSQAKRVAQYFALMLIAGEIAIKARILPDTFKPKETLNKIFAKWFNENQNNKETLQVIKALIDAIDDGDNWFIENTNLTKFKPKTIGIIEMADNQATYYLSSNLAAQKLYHKANFNKERSALQLCGVLTRERVSIRIKTTNQVRKLYKINVNSLDKFRSE